MFCLHKYYKFSKYHKGKMPCNAKLKNLTNLPCFSLPPKVAATLCAVCHPLTFSGWRWRWAGAGFLPSVSCCFLWLVLLLALYANITGNRKIPYLLFQELFSPPFTLKMLFVCFTEADGSENARYYWVFITSHYRLQTSSHRVLSHFKSTDVHGDE